MVSRRAYSLVERDLAIFEKRLYDMMKDIQHLRLSLGGLAGSVTVKGRNESGVAEPPLPLPNQPQGDNHEG